MRTRLRYLAHLGCSLPFALLLWVLLGAATELVVQRPVTMHYVGLVVLWVCVFAAFELVDAWGEEREP